MKILLLTHSFNSLTQRLHAELAALGHDISVEYDIADSVSEEAVALFRPDLILAPFLKRAIPESIWRTHVCLIIHPGIVGDRGPSALDWAIQGAETEWGVTVLQAEAEMDAGPIWATARFPLRRAKKASVYRREVADAAWVAIREAIDKLVRGEQPVPLAQYPVARGQRRPPMRQSERRIDWQRDDTTRVLAKIDAADGFPGVADSFFDEACHLYDAWPEARLRGAPGQVIARRETALCRATRDGAVWIGHVKKSGGFKLPTTIAFAAACREVPEVPLHDFFAVDYPTWQDIRYEEAEGVGFLHFDFYNGAMGTRQCQRLTEAFHWAACRETHVIVLMGGSDVWSNGIHLNLIEAASSPADESWANINAIDDLAEAILRCESQLTVAALGGNAGAGGCFLARACDAVWVRDGVVLNPHYKNMGNLYGSEFWTYLLPKRIGAAGATALMQHRLPMLAGEAVRTGFYDAVLPAPTFHVDVARRAIELVPTAEASLAAKRDRRTRDEAERPLADWRAAELAEMRRNFYGFDPSYHVARWHFVAKSPHSWTPRHLSCHRKP